jgi:hypothetical protein
MCGFRRPVARTTSRLDFDKWPNRVSPLVQSRRFDEVRVTSAFPPIATKERTLRDVSNVPTTDIHSWFKKFASSFRLRAERNRHGVPKLEGSDHVLRRGLIFLEMSRFEMGLICILVCVYLEHRDMGRIVFVGHGI